MLGTGLVEANSKQSRFGYGFCKGVRTGAGTMKARGLSGQILDARRIYPSLSPPRWKPYLLGRERDPQTTAPVCWYVALAVLDTIYRPDQASLELTAAICLRLPPECWD